MANCQINILGQLAVYATQYMGFRSVTTRLLGLKRHAINKQTNNNTVFTPYLAKFLSFVVRQQSPKRLETGVNTLHPSPLVRISDLPANPLFLFHDSVMISISSRDWRFRPFTAQTVNTHIRTHCTCIYTSLNYCTVLTTLL